VYKMSVVVASLNGEARIERCFRALDKQTIAPDLEIIVVDDGSTDDTAEIASKNGANVLRHVTNRGVSAARNSGMRAASAPIVAFLDDDCEPGQEWAERLLLEYNHNVLGVGGAIQACSGPGFIYSYVERRNRYEPLDLNLSKSERIPYRFYLYIRQQWTSSQASGKRDVYAFGGGNMSYTRSALLAVGGFDERFRDGGEEQDLCRRLLDAFPAGRLVFVPEAPVIHHFKASLRAALRRNYAYGRGKAQYYRKWPTARLTFFPGPILLFAILGLAIRFPELAVAALIVPQVLYPGGIRSAITERRPTCLLDAYVQLAQESWENAGFINGLWSFRHLPVHVSNSKIPAMTEAQES
jgi:GT2 family glycosyltransferase